jgi:IS4 transposase
VRYYDSETERELVFLTNNLEIPALTVAMLYKMRWRIELFFRWIKGHLRIKHFYGTSPNAVKTQIWIAVATYLMVAILHKQMKLPGTLHRTLQLLSVHPFEKVTLNELFTESACCLIEADTEKISRIVRESPVASQMETPWRQPWT